ncbi:unnamed protein product [Ostreobium quekettii]|uniref:Uncharacterized protein n=1 Tax=Ostreobium quekettii TaxID=121088 RepID=A0A8S1J5X3_9CHLO|nr:unnamed protein product [Ostreobium quekettii]
MESGTGDGSVPMASARWWMCPLRRHHSQPELVVRTPSARSHHNSNEPQCHPPSANNATIKGKQTTAQHKGTPQGPTHAHRPRSPGLSALVQLTSGPSIPIYGPNAHIRHSGT